MVAMLDSRYSRTSGVDVQRQILSSEKVCPFKWGYFSKKDAGMESGSSPSIDAVLADGASQARIVVVGRGYANILNMVRSFGEAGHRVDVLRVFKNASSTKRPLLSMKPEAAEEEVEA